MTDIGTLEARVAELERMLGVGVPRLAPVGMRFVRDLVALTAQETGLPSSVIIGESRVQEHVRARFAVTWVARTTRGVSYERIGRVLGGRDHSSIVHAERRSNDLRDTDNDFRALTDALVAATLAVAP